MNRVWPGSSHMFQTSGPEAVLQGHLAWAVDQRRRLLQIYLEDKSLLAGVPRRPRLIVPEIRRSRLLRQSEAV
jgi:hypothetical protein